jgi:hypothetical protein
VFDYYVEPGFSFQVAPEPSFLERSGRIPAMSSSDANSGGGDREVFGSLPRSRPQRRSAKRASGAAAARAQAPATPGSPPSAAARPKPGSRPKAEGKPPAAKVPPAGYATPDDDAGPHGVDLVTTAVQAAGELAQIGIAAGGRAVKSVIQRLPRP